MTTTNYIYIIGGHVLIDNGRMIHLASVVLYFARSRATRAPHDPTRAAARLHSQTTILITIIIVSVWYCNLRVKRRLTVALQAWQSVRLLFLAVSILSHEPPRRGQRDDTQTKHPIVRNLKQLRVVMMVVRW